MPRPVWIPEDETADSLYPSVMGSISNKFSAYDGMTDEEAEELKKELDARHARKIQAGFAPGKKRVHIGGRRAGSWPKIGWL